MAPPKRILDSHIHLWPHSAANNTGHAWMQPHAHLSKQYSLTDYQESVNFKPIQSSMSATSSPTSPTSSAPVQPTGVVYVETDRRIGDSSIGSVTNWASEPLEEVKFIRRVVEGTVTEDEKNGFGGGKGSMIKGIVFWAPFNQGVSILEEYLAEAEKLAGKETWRRVKGFRYLLQGIKDEEEFRKLALSDSWIECLRALRSKGRNYSFDVGVDMRSGGVWQLEAAVEMIEKCNQGLAPDKQVTFILSTPLPTRQPSRSFLWTQNTNEPPRPSAQARSHLPTRHPRPPRPLRHVDMGHRTVLQDAKCIHEALRRLLGDGATTPSLSPSRTAYPRAALTLARRSVRLFPAGVYHVRV